MTKYEEKVEELDRAVSEYINIRMRYQVEEVKKLEHIAKLQSELEDIKLLAINDGGEQDV